MDGLSVYNVYVYYELKDGLPVYNVYVYYELMDGLPVYNVYVYYELIVGSNFLFRSCMYINQLSLQSLYLCQCHVEYVHGLTRQSTEYIMRFG